MNIFSIVYIIYLLSCNEYSLDYSLHLNRRSVINCYTANHQLGSKYCEWFVGILRCKLHVFLVNYPLALVAYIFVLSISWSQFIFQFVMFLYSQLLNALIYRFSLETAVAVFCSVKNVALCRFDTV